MGSAELNKNKKIRTMETVVQSVLILILMILVILLGVFDGFIGLSQALLYNFVLKATHMPFFNI